MINLKIFLFAMFISTTTLSQKKHIVTYQAFSVPTSIGSELEAKIKNKILLNRINKTFNSNDTLECLLIIKGQRANFFKIEKINYKNKSIVDILVGDGFFHSSVSEKYVIEERNSFDKRYLIKHDSINWQLTNEEKKIGNYICKKAIGDKEIVNDVDGFNTKIVAWYAPSIPLNFGPKNFFGLPGLILELKDRQMIYKVTKLELNTNNKKLKVRNPKKGKSLTYPEYEKELKDIFKKFKSNNN